MADVKIVDADVVVDDSAGAIAALDDTSMELIDPKHEGKTFYLHVNDCKNPTNYPFSYKSAMKMSKFATAMHYSTPEKIAEWTDPTIGYGFEHSIIPSTELIAVHEKNAGHIIGSETDLLSRTTVPPSDPNEYLLLDFSQKFTDAAVISKLKKSMCMQLNFPETTYQFNPLLEGPYSDTKVTSDDEKAKQQPVTKKQADAIRNHPEYGKLLNLYKDYIDLTPKKLPKLPEGDYVIEQVCGKLNSNVLGIISDYFKRWEGSTEKEMNYLGFKDPEGKNPLAVVAPSAAEPNTMFSTAKAFEDYTAIMDFVKEDMKNLTERERVFSTFDAKVDTTKMSNNEKYAYDTFQIGRAHV